jgi:hypothetical protein
VPFRQTARALDFWVDVWLREYDGRWLAVADIGGEPEIDRGASAPEALTGSLASLGDRAAGELLADPQPLAVSRKMR